MALSPSRTWLNAVPRAIPHPPKLFLFTPHSSSSTVTLPPPPSSFSPLVRRRAKPINAPSSFVRRDMMAMRVGRRDTTDIKKGKEGL